MPVELQTLQSDTVKESSEFVGQLEAVQVVEISPEIQGRIERILVEPGQSVSAGQAIMVLKPDQTVPEYQGALAGVDVATSARDNALEQLDIAIAQRETARAELELITVGVARAQLLAAQGAIAEFDLDQALFEQEAAENSFVAAEDQVEAAEAAVRQAEDSIRQARAQANSSLVSVQLKEVVTPIAGIVDNLPVNVGDYVSTGQSVVAKVTQTEALFLNIQVPANRASQLETGLEVELIDPANQALLATGSLTFVSPTVNTEGQTVLAKARFRNVEGKLRDGQNVQARLIWDTQSGLLIPTTAITRVGGQAFVFVVADEPNEAGQEIVSLNPVELGDIQGSSYQVISGLETGDRIAVSNILKLQDGAPIQPGS